MIAWTLQGPGKQVTRGVDFRPISGSAHPWARILHGLLATLLGLPLRLVNDECAAADILGFPQILFGRCGWGGAAAGHGGYNFPGGASDSTRRFGERSIRLVSHAVKTRIRRSCNIAATAQRG